jgi:hypothetical protein
MAQETGTQILSRARIKCQDNDTTTANYAVSAADALVLLNDVLYALSNNARVKPKWIAATTSGLTFNAGDSSALANLSSQEMNEIESFHPSNSSSLTYPIAPALTRVSVQQILDMLAYDGDHALAQGASEWTHVAAEPNQADTAASGADKWRVWAYPVINRTRYLTMRVPVAVQIVNIGDYPDLGHYDSRVVSSLLAYEMAKLKKETSQAFLDNILRGVPKEVLDVVYGGAVLGSQLQSGIAQVMD